MELGKMPEVEAILLDHRISVTQYPLDLWCLYITRMCQTSQPDKAINLIDRLSSLIISDKFPKLYNMVLEKHIILKHRSQTSVLFSLARHLIDRKVPITYYNQLEILYQAFNSEKAQLPTLMVSLDYTLEVNVYNFFLNLVLDLHDTEMALALFSLVVNGALRSVTLEQVDTSKEHLKHLLMI
jgi:hypothetical protein